MARTKRAPATNRLLDKLSREALKRFLAGCEPVKLALGQILAQPGEVARRVYFPIGSFISLTMKMDGAASLEVALVGNEGMLGAPLALGVKTKQFHAKVQGAGPALRMTAARFRRELGKSPALRQVIQNYLFVRMSQLGQTAGCTRFHLVEQRLARWLLMIADREHSETFHMTHELLAHTLGVRRVGVTKAATSLQNRKLIRYSRGNISIRDRSGLEAAACGCYQTDKDTYEHMMGP